MKVFYHVQDETEMATCKYIMGVSTPVSLINMLPESVDEIQVSLSENKILLVSGTYDRTKGYNTQFHHLFSVSGLSVNGTKIVYFIILPETHTADGVGMVGIEMEAV